MEHSPEGFDTAIKVIGIVAILAFIGWQLIVSSVESDIETSFREGERRRQRQLWPPQAGDRITLTNGNKQYRYKVLEVDEPQGDRGQRTVIVQDLETRQVWHHGVLPDFTISYWGYGT